MGNTKTYRGRYSMTVKPKQKTPASFKQKKLAALTSHFLSLCVPSSCSLCCCTKARLREGSPEKATCPTCKMKWSNFISAAPSWSEEQIAQKSKSLIPHCQLLATTSSQVILPKLVTLFWQCTPSKMFSLQVGICHWNAQKPQVVFSSCYQSKDRDTPAH